MTNQKMPAEYENFLNDNKINVSNHLPFFMFEIFVIAEIAKLFYLVNLRFSIMLKNGLFSVLSLTAESTLEK